jgi:hypothetical protein
MTREEAIALHDSGFWKDMTYEERARFQLFERKLCMPFGVFHEAIEKALGRPVYIHEFGSSNVNNLKKELLGEAPAPTLEDIINMIPEEKRVFIFHPDYPLPDADRTSGQVTGQEVKDA